MLCCLHFLRKCTDKSLNEHYCMLKEILESFSSPGSPFFLCWIFVTFGEVRIEENSFNWSVSDFDTIDNSFLRARSMHVLPKLRFIKAFGVIFIWEEFEPSWSCRLVNIEVQVLWRETGLVKLTHSVGTFNASKYVDSGVRL